MQSAPSTPFPPDARRVLRDLIGQRITTLSGEPNHVIAAEGDRVIVGTTRSPEGNPVPIVEVQAAIDQLFALGTLEIRPLTVGYRSAFIGAVLKTLPGVTAHLRPARVELARSQPAPTPPSPWTLRAGDQISREQLHDEFGGNRQRGISFSARSPNIFIFSHPSSGTQHGYLDHWEGDVFHYYGEGRLGDQELSAGNLAIASHAENATSLRVFEGTGGVVRFLGTFEVDRDDPYYWTNGVDQSGHRRRLVVFRLRPADGQWIKGNLPSLDSTPLTHGELQGFLADLVDDAGCEPFYAETDEPLFEVGWITLTGSHVIAEIRDFTDSEDDVLSRGLGHLLLAQFELQAGRIDAAPVLFVPSKPANRAWVDAAEEHGVTVAWPGATQGIPLI